MKRYARNSDKRTSEADARRNILAAMARDPAELWRKSELGRVAFPGYSWGRPQGAAFAVARIVRHMETDGVVRWSSHGDVYGWRVTVKGMGEAGI
jgi:hypothetical protein